MQISGAWADNSNKNFNIRITRSDILQGQALFRGVKQGKKEKKKKRRKEKQKKRKNKE